MSDSELEKGAKAVASLKTIGLAAFALVTFGSIAGATIISWWSLPSEVKELRERISELERNAVRLDQGIQIVHIEKNGIEYWFHSGVHKPIVTLTPSDPEHKPYLTKPPFFSSDGTPDVNEWSRTYYLRKAN